MLYQICVLNKATKGTPQIVTATELVNAETMQYASKIAEKTHKKNSFRVYPFCTPTDGEGQMELAKYALYSYEKWERQFDNSALNPQRRTAEDREDFLMIACVAINTIFADNPQATMFECSHGAFSAIAAEQRRIDRKATREYSPDWITCNITPKKARATYPELDRLLKKAIAAADLTNNQANILNMAYIDGMPIQRIADELGLACRQSVWTVIYRAQYKVLCSMLELDPELQIFTKSGIVEEDIDEVEKLLRKRARK